MGLVLFGAVSSVFGQDGREIAKWEWRQGDGAIFGEESYKSNQGSWPRGILSLPELARDDVDVYSLSDRQSIVQVKATGACLLIFQYSTAGEDNGHGVYAIDFGRGGGRLVFTKGKRTNAPRGVHVLSHFPTLGELTLPDADLSAEELKAVAACGRLRMLMLGRHASMTRSLRCWPGSIRFGRCK
jgi:hypothetical protein